MHARYFRALLPLMLLAAAGAAEPAEQAGAR